MTHRFESIRSLVFLLVVVGLAWGASACSFETRGASIACAEDGDCPGDSACVAGVCQLQTPQDAVSFDSATDSAPTDDVGGQDGSIEQDTGGPPEDAGDVGDPSSDADPADPDAAAPCVDGDGDGVPAGAGCTQQPLDCRDDDQTIFPGADEVCDGLDNDCDGDVDPGCDCIVGAERACGSGQGACEQGVQRCEAGSWSACSGAVLPAQEVCDGVDNDCDGAVDNGVCACTSGDTRPCGTDVGSCERGVQECEQGQWGACEGAVRPGDEFCDGFDNDCNGTVDDNLVDAGSSCTTGLPGTCASGLAVCAAGSLSCEPLTSGGAEVCDGIDNDCNGEVDDSPSDVGVACATGEAGVCAAGTTACLQGTRVCERDVSPSAELCNNLDDNCDGQVDEVYPQAGQVCDTGLLGVCAGGELACSAGRETCEPVAQASVEVCDGLDNDCDGLVDEDIYGMQLTRTCGSACPNRGLEVCTSGAWSTCLAEGRERCDGTDANCDSVVDNRTECRAVCPGGGTAVGTLVCGASGPDCVLPQEICADGVDNDCDGQVDENCASPGPLDGMAFVPGGPFWMGSRSTDFGSQSDERPAHLVELDPYYIDVEEVSGGDFEACINAGVCGANFGCAAGLFPRPSNWRELPATCVSYEDARDYCVWVNKRMPTEAEWEKAARGPYPLFLTYPWGTNTINSSLAVYDCSGGWEACAEPTDSLAAGASYYGLLHMAGNIGEYTSDFYDEDFYTANYTVNPEQTVDQGDGRVVRGGSYDEPANLLRVPNRAGEDFGNVSGDEVGFRCAKDAP